MLFYNSLVPEYSQLVMIPIDLEYEGYGYTIEKWYEKNKSPINVRLYYSNIDMGSPKNPGVYVGKILQIGKPSSLIPRQYVLIAITIPKNEFEKILYGSDTPSRSIVARVAAKLRVSFDIDGDQIRARLAPAVKLYDVLLPDKEE